MTRNSEGPLSHLLLVLRDIKLEHSVFALPFALSSLLIATGGHPSPRLLVLIVLAMVSARTYAMTFNRWLDRHVDAKNPRTRGRATASGRVRASFTLTLCLGSALIFMVLAGLLNPLALALSPVVLLVLGFYSFTKRFSSACHLFLGLSLGLSAPGAWIAATGSLAAPPLLLGSAVLFWVAGFDIIYATQDEAFDRKAGLHSMVLRLGLGRALALSKIFHVLCLGLLAAFGWVAALGWPYFLAWALAAALILWEHRLVSPKDLSKVQTAFFTANGWVGLLILAGVLASLGFLSSEARAAGPAATPAATHAAKAAATRIQLSPLQAQAFYQTSLKGKALAEIGNFAASAEEFRRALLMRPDDPGTYLNLANVLYYAKQKAQAADAYAMSLHFDPNQSDMKAWLKKEKMALRSFVPGDGAAFLKWEAPAGARAFLVYRKRGKHLPDLRLSEKPLEKPEFLAGGMTPGDYGVFALTYLKQDGPQAREEALGEIQGCAVPLSLIQGKTR